MHQVHWNRVHWEKPMYKGSIATLGPNTSSSLAHHFLWPCTEGERAVEVSSDIISETLDPPNVTKGQNIIVIGDGGTLVLALSYRFRAHVYGGASAWCLIWTGGWGPNLAVKSLWCSWMLTGHTTTLAFIVVWSTSSSLGALGLGCWGPKSCTEQNYGLSTWQKSISVAWTNSFSGGSL